MNNRRFRFSRLAIVLALLTVCVPAFAQHPAVIDGRLETPDESRPVANAVIEIVHTDSNRTYTVKSDKKGRFVKPGLRPGLYDATVRCEGYHPLNVKNINVQDSQILKLVLKLQPVR